MIELLVRRFKCPNPACQAVTFAEQISGPDRVENAVPAATPASDDIGQTPPPAPVAGMLDVCGRERRPVTRTRERRTAVRKLLDSGSTLEDICRTPQLDRSTVRRFG